MRNILTLLVWNVFGNTQCNANKISPGFILMVGNYYYSFSQILPTLLFIYVFGVYVCGSLPARIRVYLCVYASLCLSACAQLEKNYVP